MFQTTHPPTHPRVEPTDGELLFRFLGDRSEEAFRNLVDRHARLVASVCRRVLWHEQDVEDAFQATFLVLVRRARGLRRRDSVAAWLFRVAHRIALRASGRRRRETTSTQVDAPTTTGTALDRLQDREEFEILASELERLPESYRLPLVLHYLEGRSRAETAEQLDCTEASVKARLARGRRLLRRRLMRRGVALSVAIGALSIPTTTQAGLVAATTSAAVHHATGGASGSAATSGSLTLAQGLPTMLALSAAKATTVIGTTLAASLLVVVGVALSQPPEGTTPAGPSENGATIDSRATTSAAVDAPSTVPVSRAGKDPAAAEPTAEAVRSAQLAAETRVAKLLDEVALARRDAEAARHDAMLLKATLDRLTSGLERTQPGPLDALLAKPIELSFVDAPLIEVIREINELTGLNLVLDRREFERAGVGAERIESQTVTVDLKGISARSALRIVLEPFDLAAHPEDEIVRIGLSDAAARELAHERRGFDLKANRPSEQRILSALTGETALEFIDTPLSDVVEFLAATHDIPIRIEESALEEEGLTLDEPINIVLRGVALDSALNLVLDPIELTYVVEDEVMKITTRTEARGRLELRVYAVGPLLDAGVLEVDAIPELLLQQEEPEGKAIIAGNFVTLRQSQPAHRKTRELLEQLHRAAGFAEDDAK